jgi:uncharacterized protein YoxC
MTDIVERVRALLGDTNEEQDTINEAANEIERLREALRKISNMGQTNVPDHWDFRVKAREIAHAALREKE